MKWEEKSKAEEKFCRTEDFFFLNQRSSQTTEEKEKSQQNKAVRNPRQRTKSRKILTVAMKRKRLLYLKKLKNKLQM